MPRWRACAVPRGTSRRRSSCWSTRSRFTCLVSSPTCDRSPAQRARVRIAQRRLADAWEWDRDHHVQQLDEPSYLDEYAQLTLVRLLLAQHRTDGDPGCLDDAAHRLDRLVPAATSGGRDGSLVEIRLLQALVADAQDDRAAALSHLGAALAAGVPAGYVRLFLDEGEPMTLLLKAAERLPMVGDHARRLGDAAYREPAVPPRAADAEGLSEREVECSGCSPRR